MKPLELSDLSIEQKIGQMLLARRPLDAEDKEGILELIRNRCLGGIHLDTVDHLIDDFPKIADYPILFCSNMENGYLKSEAVTCPMAIGATNLEEYAYEFGSISAIEAKARGHNLVFGPIVDIAMNPLSACVGPRAFGGDRELVARMSVAAVKGYQDQGMIVTAKHFPGFGESPVDSHIGMVELKADKKLLIKRDLYPYIQCIKKADLSGVMVGHIMVPKIDPKYPATISRKIISLLREIGFGGLIMTDSFAMVGMTNKFGLEQCHGLAMAAGNDMVMTSYRIRAKTAYEYMLNAYRSGKVSAKQIDAAAARVLAAQAKTLKPAQQAALTEKERITMVDLCRDSVVAIVKGKTKVSIPKDEKHLFVIQVGNQFVDPQTGKAESESSSVADLEAFIKQNFPCSDIWKINDFPSGMGQLEHILAASMNYDSIVMVAFSRTIPYSGSSRLTQRLLSFIDGVAHKLSAVVLMGNPYAAEDLPPVPRLIFGFEGKGSNQAALEALTGKIVPRGKLPVSIKFRKE